jgi:CheY-like chemotaxis protein
MEGSRMLLKNKRIFVIEDNPAYLAIISIYLRNEGAVILSERWGIKIPQSLVEMLPVDIILMDLKLYKDIDGFEIFDQIRQIPTLQEIPVVAVSALDPDTALPLARQKGFAGFIGKPFSPRLPQQIVDILSGKPVWQPATWREW